MPRGAPRLSPLASELYAEIEAAPIVSPHGHTDPAWFARNAPFADPADLLIVPDHYVFRMLYSRGIALEDLGVGVAPEDRDPRAIFRLFAENWRLFLGTPTRLWLEDTLARLFDVDEPLGPGNADAIYDRIDAALATEAFRPRALAERFGVEVLATTDAATDGLEHHAGLGGVAWPTRLIPTFRPDGVLDPLAPGFLDNLRELERLSGVELSSHRAYLDALRARRAAFRALGATATDHASISPETTWLTRGEIEALWEKARSGELGPGEAEAFYAHMLTEMAEMSVEDGLVMQVHVGSRRNTNRAVFERFGADKGADIPHGRADWARGLDALLNRVGADSRFRLVVFTLDEAAYARELAPMAGHWPCLRLGPPWWFHDSWRGIERFFESVVETAGYWNLAGFNDDTRALLSIPARHDLWRRGVAAHLASQVELALFGLADARDLARLLATDLARDTYRLN